MATVWSAWDARLNRKVAVKLLAPVLAADRNFVARFEREAQLAAGLSHPNVVTVFDYGTDEGSPYIVMEVVDGESLARRLRRDGLLSQSETVRICANVLTALQLAHDRGIVHRDVKPSNILLGSDGAVKVADFGIARLTSDATQLTDTGVMMGTVAYLSPEQCAGASATALSDIYGLGCVAYECLTGRPPFIGETPASVMYQHQHVSPRPVQDLAPEVSPELQSVVITALAKAPSDRFSSASQMRQAMNRSDGRSATTTWTASDGTTEIVRRHSSTSSSSLLTWRVTAFVAAVILLLGGVAVGIAYVGRSEPSSHASGRQGVTSTSTSGGRTGSAAGTTSSTVTTITTSAPPLTPPEALADIPSCGGCQILDMVTGLSSPSGPVSLVAVQLPGTGSYPGSSPMRFDLIGNSQQVIWSAPSGAPFSAGSTVGVHFTVDKSGNALMPIVEGAHGGQMLIIRVTPQGIDDFGTLTSGTFTSNTPTFLQPTPSGYDQIVLPINDYQPSYAQGTTTNNIYTWSTSTDAYVLTNCQVLAAQGNPGTTYSPMGGKC